MKKTMNSKNDGGGTKYAVQSNKKKNIQRLGGSTGLSLEAFANAKSRNNAYNPALLSMFLFFSSIFVFFPYFMFNFDVCFIGFLHFLSSIMI